MLSALSTLDRRGPLTMGDLCAAEKVQPPTMTRIVAALVEADLAARVRRRKDEYLARAMRDLEPHELAALEDAAAILERITGGPV